MREIEAARKLHGGAEFTCPRRTVRGYIVRLNKLFGPVFRSSRSAFGRVIRILKYATSYHFRKRIFPQDSGAGPALALFRIN